MSEKSIYTEISIEKQGKPIVNDATVVAEHNTVVCIVLDLKSKYCEAEPAWSTSKGDGVTLIATEQAIYLDDTQESDYTVIRFPEFAGWDLFAISGGRYKFNVCLTKELTLQP